MVWFLKGVNARSHGMVFHTSGCGRFLRFHTAAHNGRCECGRERRVSGLRTSSSIADRGIISTQGSIYVVHTTAPCY